MINVALELIGDKFEFTLICLCLYKIIYRALEDK